MCGGCIFALSDSTAGSYCALVTTARNYNTPLTTIASLIIYRTRLSSGTWSPNLSTDARSGLRQWMASGWWILKMLPEISSPLYRDGEGLTWMFGPDLWASEDVGGEAWINCRLLFSCWIILDTRQYRIQSCGKFTRRTTYLQRYIVMKPRVS